MRNPPECGPCWRRKHFRAALFSRTDLSGAMDIKALMKRPYWLLAIFALAGCAKVLAVREIPQIIVGEPSFFRTIEAHTDAPIVGGNKVHVLLNGAETFPVMLRDIRKAKSTITFAQYLYEDGSIAREFAEAFAERCRAGVKANILLDSHGSGNCTSEAFRERGSHQLRYAENIRPDSRFFS